MRSEIRRKFIYTGVALLVVLLSGTVGYRVFSHSTASWIDCFYMTVITITTIGFGEVIDLAANPSGRVFTMLIALSGIGVLTWTLSSITAYIVEGDLNETFRRRKMEKQIRQLDQHFIVCGVEGEGQHVIDELISTHRALVVIDANEEHIEPLKDLTICLPGDATENKVLLDAGIKRARGLFAATGDDHRNLVISLTARQLNPKIRVVASCHHPRNMEKMKAAGADDVVSPSLIGGLRMASVMVRPAAVSFLDLMLRDRAKNLRVEELTIPAGLNGKRIADLPLSGLDNTLIMAVRTKTDWAFNPPADYRLQNDDQLVVMTSPHERELMEQRLGISRT